MLKVLTEAKVFDLIRAGKTSVQVEEDTIITPSAMERLRSKKIELITQEEKTPQKPISSEVSHNVSSTQSIVDKTKKKFNIDENEVDAIKQATNYYTDAATGAVFLEKPEHMTSLRRNELVYKNHKRIIFRGKIDTFIAEVNLFMGEVARDGNLLLLEDLKTVFSALRSMQFAEVSEKPFKEPHLLGLSYDELRDHSHHPKKYYGAEHLFGMEYDAGIHALKISVLRTLSRELEVVCFDTYFKDNQVEREDLVVFLNRLSSAFYLMEIKAVSGKYGE